MLGKGLKMGLLDGYLNPPLSATVKIPNKNGV